MKFSMPACFRPKTGATEDGRRFVSGHFESYMNNCIKWNVLGYRMAGHGQL